MSDNATGGLRLQKILSQAGIASRRAAERRIAEGRVSVNGSTVLAMGVKADLAVDDVRVDGRRIKSAERRRYILLYKPAGVVTTRSDPQRRPTVVGCSAVCANMSPVAGIRHEGALRQRGDWRAADARVPASSATTKPCDGIPDTRN